MGKGGDVTFNYNGGLSGKLEVASLKPLPSETIIFPNGKQAHKYINTHIPKEV